MIKSKAWLSHTIIDGEEAIESMNSAESGEIDEDKEATSILSAFLMDDD